MNKIKQAGIISKNNQTPLITRTHLPDELKDKEAVLNYSVIIPAFIFRYRLNVVMGMTFLTQSCIV